MGTKIEPQGDDKLASMRDTEDISSFLDNELDDIDFEKFNSEEATDAWADYTLISDVLKSPELAATPRTALQARIFKALEDEPAHKPVVSDNVIPMPKASNTKSRKRLLLPSFAAAAALAMITWISLPELQGVATNNNGATGGVSVTIPNDVGTYLSAHRNVAGFSVYRNADVLTSHLSEQVRSQGSN